MDPANKDRSSDPITTIQRLTRQFYSSLFAVLAQFNYTPVTPHEHLTGNRKRPQPPTVQYETKRSKPTTDPANAFALNPDVVPIHFPTVTPNTHQLPEHIASQFQSDAKTLATQLKQLWDTQQLTLSRNNPHNLYALCKSFLQTTRTENEAMFDEDSAQLLNKRLTGYVYDVRTQTEAALRKYSNVISLYSYHSKRPKASL